jgi:hypothetical protein
MECIHSIWAVGIRCRYVNHPISDCGLRLRGRIEGEIVRISERPKKCARIRIEHQQLPRPRDLIRNSIGYRDSR